MGASEGESEGESEGVVWKELAKHYRCCSP